VRLPTLRWRNGELV